MSQNIHAATRQRLQDTVRECARHLHHMRSAMTELTPLQPFQADTLSHADDTTVRNIDQFVYRFTKLQDAMGQRLVPATLRVLGEPFEGWSMIDRLNRLEQLGFVDSADSWQAHRETRNRLTHEYPDAPEIQAAEINLAWLVADEIQAAYQRMIGRMQESEIVDLGDQNL